MMSVHPIKALEAVAPGIAPMLVETAGGPVECAAFGAGPPVLSLHGGLGGYDQSALLALTIGVAGFRYVAVSRPGYLGTPIRSRQRPQQQADLYAHLLDALGIDAVPVMAVSGGGPSALEFAIQHKSRCRGLVLASACTGPLPSSLPWRFQVLRLLAANPFFVAGMRWMMARDPETGAKRAIPDEQLRRRTLADPETGPLYDALQRSLWERMAARMPGLSNDIDQCRRGTYALERITCPLLVVHGTADSVVPYAHATRVAEAVPRAELMTVEGGEHVCIFTHREEIRRSVGRFLSACAV